MTDLFLPACAARLTPSQAAVTSLAWALALSLGSVNASAQTPPPASAPTAAAHDAQGDPGAAQASAAHEVQQMLQPLELSPLMLSAAVAVKAFAPELDAARLRQAVFDLADKARLATRDADGLERWVRHNDPGGQFPQALAHARKAVQAYRDGRLTEAESRLSALLDGLPAQGDLSRVSLRTAWDLWARIADLRSDAGAADRVMAARAQLLAQHRPDDRQERWEAAMLRAQLWDYRGNRLRRSDDLQRAVQVLREQALPLAPQDRDPLNWADTQINLGAAWNQLARIGNDSQAMRQALDASALALQELSRARRPQHWAMAHHNIGKAQVWLAEREEGTERLQAAVKAFEQALLENRRDLPQRWVQSTWSLAEALAALGAREEGTESQDRAVKLYRDLLGVINRDGKPQEWAQVQMNIAYTMATTGLALDDLTRLAQSTEAYEQAFSVFSPEGRPGSWTSWQWVQGRALTLRGEQAGDRELLARAVQAFERVLPHYPRDREAKRWARTRVAQGQALQAQVRLTPPDGQRAVIEQALAAWQDAASVLTPEVDAKSAERQTRAIAELRSALAGLR